MKIGFTGTSQGMSEWQKAQLRIKIAHLGLIEFHHGDCVGADAEAHEIVSVFFYNKIVIHPPLNTSKEAFCQIRDGGEIRPAKDYLTRNHDIVDETDLLIAAPLTTEEVLRSGTWATIRYAKKQGKPIIMIPR
jgi:hypothetical protein